ncbi:MAG: MarR family transcriptional regulator [Defluviitaleaceae bacterium]|nr:MarR family transcriptional regulator [Defluviitaleaceae bacterium]
MNNELYEKMGHLQWLLRKRRMRGYAEGGPMADTTRGQGRILAVLKLRDGVSTKDLSYLLGVRVSSLNELLYKMEKNGYITREPSEQDKRVMLCKLTDKGRQEEQPDASASDDVFACLSDDEQKTLDGLLDRMIAALHENDDDEWDEEMFARMQKLREHFGDMPGAAFGGRFRGRGGYGFERFGRGDCRGGRDDFRGHHGHAGYGRCGGGERFDDGRFGGR